MCAVLVVVGERLLLVRRSMRRAQGSRLLPRSLPLPAAPCRSLPLPAGAGDHFVLWSEEAVVLQGDEQEQQLLQAGSELLRREQQQRRQQQTQTQQRQGLQQYQQDAEQQMELHEGQQLHSSVSVTAGRAAGSYDGALTASAGGSESGPPSYGTYLGLTYQKQGGGSLPANRSTNNFVLLGPNGSTVWHYVKAYPVPMVEAGVMPGGCAGVGVGGQDCRGISWWF